MGLLSRVRTYHKNCGDEVLRNIQVTIKLTKINSRKNVSPQTRY